MKSLLIFLVIFTNASYAQTSSEVVSNISKLRAGTESTLTATPYRVKEHQAIKDYFVSVNELAIQLKDNSKFNRNFNIYLAGQEMAKFCSEVLVSVQDWNEIKVNCTRNRFFLCADEVNQFTEYKKSLVAGLRTDLQQVFKNTSECQ